jgi:hypothetical protein
MRAPPRVEQLSHMRALELKGSLARATFALRYETAANMVSLIGRRLCRAVQLRYNPNWASQPRDREGQWTDGIGRSDEGAIVREAANKPDIKFITYLLDKYGIFDRKTRRRIHDDITRHGLSREEIEYYISGFGNDR